MKIRTYPSFEALKARKDLEDYKDNALLLFALELRFEIDDIHAVAEQALTDGYDDKKCDLVYVDRENNYALVAQGYFSTSPDKRVAPANKASDLNTAASWLLSMEINQLPATIRSAAQELRDAVESGDIETLEFWYTHNLPESVNVRNELASVERTAVNAIRQNFPTSKCQDIRSIEVGINILEAWYKAINTPILVNKPFTIPIPGGYPLETGEWHAYATTISAAWLYQVYQDHGTDLFSANPRGYLGSRRSDKNINNRIKDSAKKEPDKFWAFNNGITALVNNWRIINSKRGKQIRIDGISIVNGAQTTGAIGSLSAVPNESAMVPARFIKCSSRAIVQKIVEYNNSQNKMVPSDFRSSDSIQKRLRLEFQAYPQNIVYTGGRRGGVEDKIRRNPNIIPSDTVAQALAAFHGRPRDAYNTKSQLWKSDRLYNLVFNEHTHADHMIFCYSLYKVISGIKRELMNKSRASELLTEAEKDSLSFLRLRGATFLLIAALGSCIESIVNRPIVSKFHLRFRDKPSLEECESFWQPIVEICLSLNTTLLPPLEGSLKNNEEIQKAISQFTMFVGATKKANESFYTEFASQIVLIGRDD